MLDISQIINMPEIIYINFLCRDFCLVLSPFLIAYSITFEAKYFILFRAQTNKIKF